MASFSFVYQTIWG